MFQSPPSGQRRVPPIRLMGVSGCLHSLFYGLLVGVGVGVVVAAVALPLTPPRMHGGLVLSLCAFGLVFGPMLTVGAASQMAVAGVRLRDFAVVGWTKLIVCAISGLAVGVAVGLLAGLVYIRLIPAGDVVVFVFMLVGGILGFVLPPSRVVGRAARARAPRACPKCNAEIAVDATALKRKTVDSRGVAFTNLVKEPCPACRAELTYDVKTMDILSPVRAGGANPVQAN